MPSEDLQAWLRIGVVRGFEAQPVDAHLPEKDLHEANQTAKREAKVGNHAFHLVELGEMRVVDGFVAEDAVDGEIACGPRLGGKFVKHVGGNGGGVGAEHQL